MIIISQNGDKVETNELRVSGHNIVALNANDTNDNITVATYLVLVEQFKSIVR